VTVYGADWCSACKNARAYFGQRHDIEFIYLDINREQRAYNDALNRAHAQGVPAAGVPIIEVGSAMNSRDSRFFVGFYPDEMNHVLSDDAPAAKSPRASAEPPRSAPRK
jgi:glutaredoxin